jgi:hypothetical protein
MGPQGLIEYRPTPEYLHATVIGPRTREFVSRFCDEVPERCARLGYRRLLIEMRLEGEPFPLSTIFDLVRHFIAEIKGHPNSVSVVALVGRDRDIVRLAEIVSANRVVDVAGFTEVSKAESWLLGSTGGPREVQRDA